MKKITLSIDQWGHKELESYLKSLKGIKSVLIKDEKHLEITLEYDEKLIDDNIIIKEIRLFLDMRNIPALFAFDRYHDNTKEYIINKQDICCEYCYYGAIEDLYNMKGIISVKSNFWEMYYENPKNFNLEVIIKYDANIIHDKELKKINEILDI